MNQLYEAIGTIAATAHANGDTIDENIRPEDNFNLQHGLEIIHKSNYMRIGKHRDEERFEVTSPYLFLNALRGKYTDEDLASRANADLNSLSPEEQTSEIEAILADELKEATDQYDTFTEAYSEEIAPTETDLIKITHGDEDLWNGFVVRDYLYPYQDSFSISDYRRAVSKVRTVRIEATKLVHEVVDIFGTDGPKELDSTPETEPRADHHQSSPGFQ